MKKFNTRSAQIEAVQWNCETLVEAISFCAINHMPNFTVGSLKGKYGLIIPRLKGDKGDHNDYVAQKGDWIIKGSEGEYYPCKPAIFEMEYKGEIIMNFQEELRDLINKHSLQIRSNIPGPVLADYLIDCLEAFINGVQEREDHKEAQKIQTRQDEAKEQDQEKQVYTYKQMEELCGEAKKQGKQEVLHLIRNDLKEVR